MTPVRILIADDHEVSRRGLKNLLEAQMGWEVCGEALNGRAAVEKAKLLRPDVAVLDISMPELNGLEVTRQIAKVAPNTQVLILTLHESEELVREVMAAGARGFVLKSDPGRYLVEAINALLKHRLFISPNASGAFLGGVGEPLHGMEKDIASLHQPSYRERQILQLLAEGKTNKEIAMKLGLTARTAETHRKNIMRKLNLHSYNELVRYAIRNKIIQV